MAAMAVVSITGQVTGGPSGSKSLSSSISSVAAVDAVTDLVLVSGFNSVAVPAGATGVLIQPPAANVVALTLKGVTGDTGVRLHSTNPSLICLDPSAVTIGITAGSLTVGATEFSWF